MSLQISILLIVSKLKTLFIIILNKDLLYFTYKYFNCLTVNELRLTAFLETFVHI